MDTTTEIGIIVSGTTVYGTRLPGHQITLVEGDCLISFIPKLGKHGLFSVPAPSQHPCGVRRGFLLLLGRAFAPSTAVCRRVYVKA